MQFRVLGPLEVETDAGTVTVTGARPRALLVALLLAPRVVVPVHRLTEAVWGDDPPVHAEGAVQTTVARLRRALGSAAACVVTKPPGYLLAVDDEAVDAALFESLCRAGRTSLPAPSRRPLCWTRPLSSGVVPPTASSPRRSRPRRPPGWTSCT